MSDHNLHAPDGTRFSKEVELGIEGVLARLDNVETVGDGWKACCPIHDDNSPSLYIKRGEKQPLVMYCQVCQNAAPYHEILAAIGLRPSDVRRYNGDWRNPDKSAKADVWKVVKRYAYRDADGNNLYCSERLEDWARPGKKSFALRHATDSGGWGYGLSSDIKRVIYRLPEILATDPGELIFFVEGEKCAEHLVNAGLNATCVAQGANAKSWHMSMAGYFEGRIICVLSDHDDKGIEFANVVSDSLARAGVDCTLVNLGDEVYAGPVNGTPRAKGYDVFDWMQEGHDGLELVDIARLNLKDNPFSISADEPPLATGYSRSKSKHRGEDGQDQLSVGEVFEEYERIEKLFGIQVLGYVGSSEHIAIHGLHSGQTMTYACQRLERIKPASLSLLVGPENNYFSDSDDDDGSSGRVPIAKFREAICWLASRNLIESSGYVDKGIWTTDDDDVVIVNGRRWYVVRDDGKIEQIFGAKFKNLILDSSTTDEWVDINELENEVQGWDCEKGEKAFEELTLHFDRWCFARDKDECLYPTALVGAIAATWFQASWDWRPQLMIWGKSRSGKSLLLEQLGNADTPGLFGRNAVRTANTTVAGLTQALGSKNVPLVIDELDTNQHRAKILEMIRGATRGTDTLRGTPAQKAKKQATKMISWCGGIDSGLTREADQNRFLQIRLERPPVGKETLLNGMPSSSDLDRMGRALMVGMIANWRKAREISRHLIENRPEGVDPRVCESLSPISASVSAVCCEPLEEALERFSELVTLGPNSEEIRDESDSNRTINWILSRQISAGRNRYPIMLLLQSDTTDVSIDDWSEGEQNLRSCGVRCMRSDKVSGVPKGVDLTMGVFIAPQVFQTQVLDTNRDMKGVKLADKLIELDGAVRTRQRLLGSGGSPKRGVWIPAATMGLDPATTPDF